MTRSEDLHTLGLSSEDDEAQDSQRRIRKAFLRLSRTHHPDKGGSNEGFQKLSAAYYRLRDEGAQVERDVQDEDEDSDATEEHDDQSSSWEDYEFYNFWHQEFFNFFRQNSYEEYEYSDVEDDFYSWEQEAYERKKAWSNIHKQKLKAGIDFRDSKANREKDACVFCGENKPIQLKEAKKNGIVWDEYVKSMRPRTGEEDGYNTCWVCKAKHKSVMTEAMAKTKFAKKLNGSSIFRELRRAKYTFSAQPATDLCEFTRTSEYFWYPDVEKAALAAGWKPRGKQKESVPWWPKNKKLKATTTPSTSVAAITPGSSTKRKKRRRSDGDDRKPSAKRGLKL